MLFSFSLSFPEFGQPLAHAAHLKRAVCEIQMGSKQGMMPGEIRGVHNPPVRPQRKSGSQTGL
jgi:hypothetical protein